MKHLDEKKTIATPLRWLGNGFFYGIPARDLSAEEAEKHGYEFLINSGHYEPFLEPGKEDKWQE